jgi:PAB-dependent poly(A)-specific ribonuclease subunit 2
MCELGFLFHMFQLQSDEKNGTRTCSPKNMLRTLEALSKGYFGGLFDEEYESLSSIVEKFNRLLLTRLHEESTHHTLANGKENGPCVIQKLLGSTISSTKSCTSCGSKHVTQSQSFNFKLKRPSVQMDPENTSSAKPDSFSSMLVKTLSNQMQAHSFCEKCDTFQINYVSQEVESLPPHVVVSCCFYGEAGEEAFWSAVSDGYTPARSSTPVDHWIPFYIRIFKEPSASGESSTWIVQEFDKIPPQLEEDDGSIYELSGVISTTKDDEIQHSVAQIRNEQGDQWHLFNDFHVAPCGRMEAVHVSSQWKIPTVIHYTRRNSTVTVPPEAYVSPITPSAFYTACPTPGTDPITRPEQLDELEKVLAIDAEFVLLNEEQTEDSHGGTRIVSPNEFGVARISLIGTRKDNQLERCIMDDYVSHDSSKIVDYLTQFSGIIPGDLDKTTSKHHVITLKEVYLKLRYLVDAGYTFVGHGLSKDFSTINIVVPSKQVIDTVTIYHLENQRMISLRFLASVLLGIDIQQTTHDSIEDSRTALQLYRMHEKLVKEGRFDEVLQEIYSIGRKRLWKIHKSDRAGIASPSPVKASSSVETLAHSLSDQQAPTELED